MINMTAWADIDPEADPGMIALGCSKAEQVLARQIPGCTIGKDAIWRFPLTWPTYACFRTVWQHQAITIYPALEKWAGQKWEEIQERYRMRAALKVTDVEGVGTGLWSLDTPDARLSGPQEADAEWLYTWRRVILGSDRGSGKTPPTIRAMQLMGPGALPALVICPDSAPLEWQRKLRRWAPELRVVIIGGAAGKRAKAIEQLAEGKADVGVICWQNVRYHTRLAMYPGQAFVRCTQHGGEDTKITPGRCEVHPKDLNDIKLGLVVADECHRMADPTSKQTRAVWHLMHRAENVFALTGTLTTQDVGTLWPVLHGLDPRGFPGRGRWNDLFAQQDFAFAGKGSVILGLRPDTAETFHVIVDPMFRRTPKAIARAGQPGLAEPEFRFPPLTPKQDKAYREVAKNGLLEFENGQPDMVPDNSAVAFTRLCQLAGSMVEMTEGEDGQGFTQYQVKLALPSNKVNDLLEFLSEEDGQWVVAVNSPMMLDLAAAKLKAAGISHTAIVGGMSYQQKDAAAQAFQNGEHRVIFVNSAGNEAIDLQAGEGVFWLQPNPSFTYREQMTGRVDRWGQRGEVRQVWCLSPGTVDIRLYELGLDKEEQHQQVVRDPQMLRWMMDVQPGEIMAERQQADGTGTSERAASGQPD